MSDQNIADAILAMAKLSSGERSVVMHVVERLGEGSQVAKPSPEASKSTKNRPYSEAEIATIRTLAFRYPILSPKQRREAFTHLAEKQGRTFEAIRQRVQEERLENGVS